MILAKVSTERFLPVSSNPFSFFPLSTVSIVETTYKFKCTYTLYSFYIKCILYTSYSISEKEIICALNSPAVITSTWISGIKRNHTEP